MSLELSLFDDLVDKATIDDYHIVNAFDDGTKGCNDCKHCFLVTPRLNHDAWRCRLRRRETDPWLGACGRWEGENT